MTTQDKKPAPIDLGKLGTAQFQTNPVLDSVRKNNKIDLEAALEAFNRLDQGLSVIRNMMNEPDEITAMNVPSFKADIDCMIRDIRVHGTAIRTLILNEINKGE